MSHSLCSRRMPPWPRYDRAGGWGVRWSFRLASRARPVQARPGVLAARPVRAPSLFPFVNISPPPPPTSSLYFPIAKVRDIQEATAKSKKADEEAAKAARRAATTTSRDADKAALRAAIEADKAERAACEPIETASIAQKLPTGGARIATARDAGIET